MIGLRLLSAGAILLVAPITTSAPPVGSPAPGPGASDRVAAGSDSVAALVRRAGELREEDPAAAARLFARAADGAEPAIAAWIRLSEAQAAARAGDTAAVRAAVAALESSRVVPSDSVRLARARAALGAGDTARGVELGRALAGSADPELWAEGVAPALLAAGDSAATRRGLTEAAEADPSAGATTLLLGLEPDGEELVQLARWDHAAGRHARAVRLLGLALEEAPARDRARLWRLRAEAELAAGRPEAAHRSAGRGLAVVGTGTGRAELELISARTHLTRGQAGQAAVHLRRGRTAGGGDRSARAGYLLADLAHDRGRTAEARERYRRVAEAYPGTPHGGIARMRLGLLSFREGRHGDAADHFRAYRRARPRGGWATASVYWEARALATAGRRGEAEAQYRGALERDPVSWYGLRAAHRLGDEPLAAVLAAGGGGREAPVEGRPRGEGPAAASDGGAVERLVGRMDRLRSLGWTGRALVEYGSVDVDSLAGGRTLELAHRLNDAGWTGQGIRLGWEAFDRRKAWTRPLLRAIWPLPHREAVVRAAAAHSVPPALVAAVVRQESAFDPRAVSRAGAVGLMQIMPATAADLAGAPPDPEALMQPGVSLDLGAGYLSSLLLRFEGSLVGALSAYNAGPRRWRRWRRFPEAEVDPELLVERIPFGETRRYVKAVLRNVYLYARLHGLEDGERPPAAPTVSAGAR